MIHLLPYVCVCACVCLCPGELLDGLLTHCCPHGVCVQVLDNLTKSLAQAFRKERLEVSSLPRHVRGGGLGRAARGSGWEGWAAIALFLF